MASIFITGSADGLGQLAARRLVALGHDVVMHGRNHDRAQDATRAVPGARTALEGDLASIEQTRALAQQANAAGPFQAVIHNAGIYRPSAGRRETVDGLDDVFAINAVAPYLLTVLIEGPQRLPGDLEQGVATQVWLAISDEHGAKVTGRYFYHKRTPPAHPAASDVTVQNGFLSACEQLTGVRLASAVTK